MNNEDVKTAFLENKTEQYHGLGLSRSYAMSCMWAARDVNTSLKDITDALDAVYGKREVA